MMLYKGNVKKYLLASLLMGTGTVLFAQEKTTKKETAETPVTIDSFDVVRDYKPILADAVKIRRSPDMANKKQYHPKLAYNNIIDKRLEENTGLKQLSVQEIPFSHPVEQSSNYAKLGIGNFNTILAEAYLAVDSYENTRFGVFAKHLNQKGDIEGQKFSRQDVGVFGRRTYDNFTLNGTLGYNRYSTNFYGQVFDETGTLLNATPESQTFNDITFTGDLTSNAKADQEGAMSYSAKVDAYVFKDAFNAKENSVALSGYLNKNLSTVNIGANVSVDLNTAKDVVTTKNNIANINPYVRFKGANYNVNVGVNLTSEFGDESRFNVFPAVEADFSLVPSYISLFAGADGGVKKGSLRQFAKENPYLNSGIEIKNTQEKLNIYAGIKGNAGATLGYKVKVFYKQIDGLPLFVNSTEQLSNGGYVPYKFDVVYDGISKSAKHTGLEGEINVRLSQLVNIGGKLNFDNYSLVDQEEAWGLPELRLAANARFNISDQFYVDAELATQGNTQALAYNYADGTTTTSTTPSKVTVGSFADFNLGAEYRIKKQFGVFAKMNNIFGNNYERYLYYPKLGFNVIGGINYSF